MPYNPIKRDNRSHFTSHLIMARSYKDQRKHYVSSGKEFCQDYTGAGKRKFNEYGGFQKYEHIKLARKSQEIK